MSNGIFHRPFVYPHPQVPRKPVPAGAPGPAITHTVFYAELDAAGVANPTLDVTSVTWLAGDRVYVAIGTRDSSNPPVVASVVATGLTFTEVREQDEPSQHIVWAAVWESDLAASGDTQTVTVSITAASFTGGLQVEVYVEHGTSPTTDASNGAETGATDTAAPAVDLTTVAASTHIHYFFEHRQRVFTVDGADGLTPIRENDLVGTAGNISGISTYYKDVLAQNTYNGSGTLDVATDWVALAWSVTPGIFSISPGALSLGLALPSPALVQSLAPGALSLGLATPAPSVKSSFAPGALSLGLALVDPSVQNRIQPGALDLGLALGNPNVGGVALVVAPDPLDLGLALPSPFLTQRVLPGALSLGLAQVNPSFVLSVAPGALALGLATPAPTLTVAPFLVSAGALDLGLALLSPTLLLDNPPVAGLPAVQYMIEFYNSGATFGPNTKLGEIWDARNLGWSRFDRMPGKAFFTLGQRSPYLASLVAHTTHIKIIRVTPTTTSIVWSGTLEDWDSTGDDVIFIGYDYLALLSLSRSGFKTLYPTKSLGTEIVSPEWTLAKTTTPNSPLGFVTTGTIENPLGTDGSTVIKTNAQFGTLDQPRLQLFYDLSEMGRANTVNYVTYEITKDTPHTFNFWKNRGSVQAGAFVLNGNVSDYQFLPNWITYRNDWASVAIAAAGGPAEIVSKDDTAAAARGRRQDVFTAQTLIGISGAATEADQQKAALERQLKRGLQLQPAIALQLMRGTYTPGVIGLCDKVPMEIVNGIDNITGNWSFLGETCIVDDAGEHPTVLLRPLAT